MHPVEVLRAVGPAALAVAAAVAVDRMAAAKRLDPPGFRDPVRRVFAGAVVAGVFWVGIFAALGMPAEETARDLSGVPTARLFLLHAILVGVLVFWYLLGFAGFGARMSGDMGFAAQFGLRTPRPAREGALGVVVGL